MRHRTARALVPLLAAVGVLTACTDEPTGSGSGRSPEASASASAGPEEAARALTDEVLGGEEAPDPVASASGSLAVVGAAAPVTVEVLDVRAGPESTRLRWRLRSTGSERVRVYTSALSLPNRFDTRQVALVDAVGEQRLQPYTFVPQRDDRALGCSCSTLPDSVGPTGELMYALFPPLGASTTEVDVVVPGVPPITGVPVTR